MKTFYRLLSSLRFTVVLLAVSTLLVLLGTLDQANFGIHHALERYFNSWFVVSPVVSLIGLVLFKTYPAHLDWMVLPLPGGLTLGVLLGVNLVAAHIRYYRFGWKKTGITLIHGGLVLLLISGFMGSLFQKEWNMALDEGGGPVHHLSAFRGAELAIIQTADDGTETHFVADRPLLFEGNQFPLGDSGLMVKVEAFAGNAATDRRPILARMIQGEEIESNEGGQKLASLEAELENESMLLLPIDNSQPLSFPPEQIKGYAAETNVASIAQPPTYRMNESNIAAAVVTITKGDEVIGTWLVSPTFGFIDSLAPQTFESGGETYRVDLRFPHQYLPFSLSLQNFVHRRHPNTNIPAEFASDLTLNNPETGENRHVRISMNEPLRYGGYTFYQASFANNDLTSVLQVVRNPGWQLPYISIAVIGLGLILHFLIKLLGFSSRASRKADRKDSAKSPDSSAPTQPQTSTQA